MKHMEKYKNLHKGKTIYIIGKGPSLSNFHPFDIFKDSICIGINNVYEYFPYSTYIVMWHGEFYLKDKKYLNEQKKFTLFYSDFHNFSKEFKNGINLGYAGEFPLKGQECGKLEFWKHNPDKWMYKTTFATAIKLAWWMGASNIVLAGCDFSLKNGKTADNDKLYVPVKLRNFTEEKILNIQLLVFENLKNELINNGVKLKRIFSQEDLKL